MWSICKKELRQFFSSLTGYIAIIVFLLVNGLVLFVFKNNVLDYGYATLEQFFSFTPWILIFLVSAITMRSFADEYKGGTYELLRTKPLTAWQLVTGKFNGSLIVALIALVPTLIYYVTINQLASTTGIDSGAAGGSYLGLFLLTAVFTAIGVCVSSFTSNAVVAFIISLIACILFYFGFGAFSQLPAFANGPDYYIEMIGISYHYQSISRGVIDTRDIVYFLSLIFFFLLITKQNLQAHEKRNKKKVLWGAGLLAGIVLVNILASTVHSRFDLTEEKRYSLTHPTKELLNGLQDELSLTIFLKGDFPSGFRKLSNSTQEFVRLMRERNSSKINYRFVSPDDDAGNGRKWADSLQAMGAAPINLTVQVKSGQENKLVFPVALAAYKNRSSLINLYEGSTRVITPAELNNAEAIMEYQFAKAIDRIINPESTAVAYAIGNGQPQDAQTFSLWYAIDPESFPDENVNPEYFDVNAKSNFKLGLFNLATQKSIPVAIKVLLIVKPTIGFSDTQKLMIDQYIMRGGKVLWFLDNLYAEQDSLSYKSQLVAYERELNLQDMLFNYGVRINPDLIMDLQCDFFPFAVGGNIENPQYEFLNWNYYPLFESANNHTINKNIGLIAGRFVNSIDTIQKEGIKKPFYYKALLIPGSSAHLY